MKTAFYFLLILPLIAPLAAQEQMKLFQKKNQAPTYRARVENFWAWWSQNGERIRLSVDEDGGENAQPEISEQIDKLCPDLAWVLGPHPDQEAQGHSLTLSPEGSRSLLFLTSYWLKKAPKIPGWHFYSSRQANLNLADIGIQIGDLKINSQELWLTAEIDEDKELLDITAWNPAFAEIEENQAMQILYLLLDEAMGENGVEQWLGIIEIGDQKLAQSFPLTELPEQVKESQTRYNWEKHPLEETVSLLKFKSPSNEFTRKDLLSLASCHPNLATDYLENKGPFKNPIAKSGAEFIFLKVPRHHFPKGEEVSTRSRFEDKLNQALESRDLGVVLGGGMGTEAGYIDLLIIDGEESRQALQQTVNELGLKGSKALPFTKR